MKLKLNIRKDRQIGNVRLKEETYKKIENLATEYKASLQEIIRAIIEQNIDNVN